MGAFAIDLSHPFWDGFTQGHGGPNSGGHQPPEWYIQYGMDLGAEPGTEVHAAFDARVTRYQPHDPATDSDKVYGAQLFMRAPNDRMGAFYTHVTDVPAGLAVGFWSGLDALREMDRTDRRWEPAMDEVTRAEGIARWHRGVERTLGWVD